MRWVVYVRKLFWPVFSLLLLGVGAALNQPTGTNSGGGAGGGGSTRVVYTVSAPSGALTLSNGGTAQNLFGAGEVVNGCAIINPTTATEQGINSAESISISFITTAVGGGGRATTILEAGQAVACPAGLTQAVSWVGATTSHAINAVKW